jgi:hypothetical protein
MHICSLHCIWIWNFNNLQFPMLKRSLIVKLIALLKQKFAENNGASALDGDGKFSPARDAAASEKIQSPCVWRW